MTKGSFDIEMKLPTCLHVAILWREILPILDGLNGDWNRIGPLSHQKVMLA